MTRARSGFTLLETILVLAMLVMLAAMAYPSLETMYVDMRVQAGADHLRAKFAEARAHAIEEGRPYRFAVMPGQGDYRLAPEDAEFWDNMGAASETATDGVAPFLLEDRLPAKLAFNLGQGTGSPDSNGWVPVLTFLPDGACDADASIRLDMEGARPVEISVRALTGSVTTRTLKMGEGR